jgi:hypothetical protein
VNKTKPMPARGGMYVQAFAGLFLRDLRVLRRELGPFALRVIMQPLLFLFVFTYLFPRIGQGASMGGAGFATVLLPGLMAVAIMFSGIAGVALPLAQEFGVTREIDDRVMCPVPVVGVAIEKICFSALQSILAALLVMPLAYLDPGRAGACACRQLAAAGDRAGIGQPGRGSVGSRHRLEREAAADWTGLLDRRDSNYLSWLRVLSLGAAEPGTMAAGGSAY